ncbi:MAG: hypothetical protein PWP69_1552 [Enterococcus sp.]|nr:hypothetical protein [Enterococcus sp.]
MYTNECFVYFHESNSMTSILSFHFYCRILSCDFKLWIFKILYSQIHNMIKSHPQDIVECQFVKHKKYETKERYETFTGNLAYPIDKRKRQVIPMCL